MLASGLLVRALNEFVYEKCSSNLCTKCTRTKCINLVLILIK